MSKTLEEILERVKSWPKERQDDAARVIETSAGGVPVGLAP